MDYVKNVILVAKNVLAQNLKIARYVMMAFIIIITLNYVSHVITGVKYVQIIYVRIAHWDLPLKIKFVCKMKYNIPNIFLLKRKKNQKSNIPGLFWSLL